MNSDTVLRQQLVNLLQGKNAHMSLEEAVADFPLEYINTKPPHITYTPWHLVEHIRITQKDILDFTLVDNYKERSWPKDYWPKRAEKASKKQWDSTITQFTKDNKQLQKIVLDPKRDLLALLPWGEPYTIFREICVVGNHNSYHIGEFAILRQVMQTWPLK